MTKHMTTIKVKSTLGNFAIEGEAEVSQAQLEVLGGFGGLQLLQRSPSSAAEKAMAGYDKRPAGFKRDSIPFSAEGANVVTTELQKPLALGDGIDPVTFAIVVTEYVPSEADVKMPDERKAYARNGSKGTLAALATKVGYAGEVGDGTSDNAPVEFLRAIRAWSKAQIADI